MVIEMKTFFLQKGACCRLTRETMGKKASSKGEGCFETPSIGYARLGWMGVANFSFQKICTRARCLRKIVECNFQDQELVLKQS